MPEPITALLVDDQRLMREGLRTLLELEHDLRVVGEATDGLSALERYNELGPDVVLMDVRMPGLDGVETARRLLAEWPAARVIILTTFDDDAYVFEGLRAGALGYLLKDVSGARLAAAIRTVVAVGVLIAPSVARKVVAEFARVAAPVTARPLPTVERLSDRETEILRLVAAGLSDREIASRLYLAEGTVNNYLTVAMQKLHARDRADAAMVAREMGVI